MKWKHVIFNLTLLVYCCSYVKAEELIIARISLGAPMLYETRDGKQEGFFVDFAAELSQRLGIPIIIKVIPRRRIEEYGIKGKIHLFGLINPKWLPETKDQFDWSILIGTNKNVIVTHKDRQIITYDDLNGLQLGCRLGFRYSEELMGKFRSGEVFRQDVKSEKQNYQKLLIKRVDAIVTSSSYIAQYNLRTIPKYRDNFQISPLVDSTQPQYFAISKHSPVPTAKLNQIFTQMQEDGTIREIFAKYGIEHFE